MFFRVFMLKYCQVAKTVSIVTDLCTFRLSKEFCVIGYFLTFNFLLLPWQPVQAVYAFMTELKIFLWFPVLMTVFVQKESPSMIKKRRCRS